MHIGIAGAGLLGRLLALQLARAGHRVEVFDPAASATDRVAAGWTAAGMLSPVAELECADQNVFAMGLRSLQLWPDIVASLDDPVEFHRLGSLLLAHRGDEGVAQRITTLLQHKAPPGHEPQRLSAQALRELEPALTHMAQAWLLPEEGQIHTVQAMSAMATTGTALGVQWHWDQAVQAVAPGELRLAAGPRSFDWVVDVRGTGTDAQWPPSEHADHPGRVRGVRGEVFWLHAPGLRFQRPLRLLHPRHRVYIVPRGGDLVVVGASEIESEDRSPVSLKTTLELLSAAHSVLPELAEARIVHTETNLRPALPDNQPRLHCESGLLCLNGLFRHGWLLAPAFVEQGLAAINSAVNTEVAA